MTEFVKTPGWLDWCPNPSKPTFVLPPGTVDAHCHIFGPGDRYPFAPERKYTPCDASAEQLFALRDRLGISRQVIVQATCHGADNSAMLDAIAASEGRARGVATVRPDVTDAELQALHDGGVRGVRFNFLKRLVDAQPHDQVRSLAARIADLGWHVVAYFEAAELPELDALLSGLPTPVLIDHLGRADVTAPLDGPEFSEFMRYLERNPRTFVKVTGPERLSQSGPPAVEGQQQPYRDVVPFARRVVEEFTDRCLWGTDWPHPNLKDHMPDDGLLVDYLRQVLTTPEQQQAVLVTNPMGLYWPDEQAAGVAG